MSGVCVFHITGKMSYLAVLFPSQYADANASAGACAFFAKLFRGDRFERPGHSLARTRPKSNFRQARFCYILVTTQPALQEGGFLR